MIHSQQAQFSISLIKRRWFKLEIYDNLESFNDLNITYIDANGNSHITQSSTILDVLRKEDSIDDIN